jgi:hypothetical protein
MRLRHVLLFLAAFVVATPAAAMQVTLQGPNGSGRFGRQVRALPNGNFVVTDPEFSFPGVPRVGAVHLYDRRGNRLRTLTGSREDDFVGSGGVTVLANGHAVAKSPLWRNGNAERAGAVTWIDAVAGTGGLVSPTNSLVGSSIDDRIGEGGVRALDNGHYVVRSPSWNNGIATRAGAVTWGNGAGGTTGEVSERNSLVGSQVDDQVGSESIVLLANGNYVVVSPTWDRGGRVDAGAVTWCSAAGGCEGPLDPDNSLVGSRDGDRVGQLTGGVGELGVIALDNGHYVVASPHWDSDALQDVGAATWGDGSSGARGAISAQNSLVGTRTGALVAARGAVALRSGHYVVLSPIWDDELTADVGAVTWAHGDGGTHGGVSSANSLVGSVAEDRVGLGGVVALDNGHYVVLSPVWAASDVGAISWADGNAPRGGIVSVANSIIGTTAGDLSDAAVTPLRNGHYVIAAYRWDDAARIDAGAVRWADGDQASSGVISSANALIGSATQDLVGSGGVTALSNGHYVVASGRWNGVGIERGAVTWRSGSGITAAPVTAANSMIGFSDEDRVGSGGVIALDGARYVIGSPSWDSADEIDVGAATLLSGNELGIGTSGVVSDANSLVGRFEADRLGAAGTIEALPGATFVLSCPGCNRNALVPDAGAVAWGRDALGTSGPLSQLTSVLPGAAAGGSDVRWVHDPARDRLIVGRPAENVVTLFDASLFRDGFE